MAWHGRERADPVKRGGSTQLVLLAWLELEQRVVDRRPARPPANDDRIVKPCAPPATCFGFVIYYTPDVR